MLLMPEWYLVVLVCALLTALGAVWRPLLMVAPLLAFSAAVPIAQAVRSAARARFPRREPSLRTRAERAALTALLHLIQPAARLYGRLRNGLDPWRLRGLSGWRLPVTTSRAIWSEQWTPASRWLEAVESILGEEGAPVERGGAFDRWDLRLRWGPCGGARLLAATEEHGAGRQYVRFRVQPHLHRGRFVGALAGSIALAAGFGGAWLPAAAFGAVALGIVVAGMCECGTAVGRLVDALEALAPRTPPVRPMPDEGTSDALAQGAAGG
jgi:hypothetical protein